MALVVFGAVRSSPGTTTAALAIAGCIPDAVVVEADPDGSVIAPRFQLRREPNVASLATATRASLDREVIAEHAQLLPGGLPAVIGLASPDRAISFWRNAGPRLAASLAALDDQLVIVDASRLTPTSPVALFAEHAAMTVLVARPTPEELLALSHRLAAIRERTRSCALLLVGDHPYGPTEVARQLDIDVLGVISHDPRAAAALAGLGDGRGLRRSALARSARDVARGVLDRVDPQRSPSEQAPIHQQVATL